MNDTDQEHEFERAAAEASPSLAAEFWQFLLHNKKWWLLPIVLVLLFFGVLVFLAGTGAAPLIYTFF
jgi:hypothetical protein